jgi:glycerate kinase
MRILIAPDSFKGSATAAEAARAIADGWLRERPDDDIRLLPLADGGEGTLDAFEAAVPGSRRQAVDVVGPDDRPARASWLLLPNGTGVVELASTSGITMLDPLLPLHAHTFGFGQAIAAALDAGVRELVLAIGGSSSTDGGLGALEALGAAFLDGDGKPITRGNHGLSSLVKADLSGMRALPSGGVIVLTDVTSPLYGRHGAAHRFGEQKGASEDERHTMDANLRRLADLLNLDQDLPGVGAAGGTGFGLVAWGAELRGGASAIGDLVDAPAAAANADVVITGEGRFDSQSLVGKVPGYVASISGDAPLLLVAGGIDGPTPGFAASVSLSDLAGSSNAAMGNPLRYLKAAGARLAATS